MTMICVSCALPNKGLFLSFAIFSGLEETVEWNMVVTDFRILQETPTHYHADMLAQAHYIECAWKKYVQIIQAFADCICVL